MRGDNHIFRKNGSNIFGCNDATGKIGLRSLNKLALPRDAFARANQVSEVMTQQKSNK